MSAALGEKVRKIKAKVSIANFLSLAEIKMSPCSLYGVLKAERHLDSLERGNRNAERGMQVW